MKIVLIIPTLKQGGSERVVSELANYWSLNNHEIHLMLLAKEELFYSIGDDVKIHELGYENTRVLNNIFHQLRIFLNLRKFLVLNQPDFVLSFMTKYNVFTILATLFSGIRVFVSDRINAKEKLDLPLSLLRKITYRWATGIIAQTSMAASILVRQTGNKNIRVIPNPLREVKLFPNIRRENIVLCVGRLVIQKGQKYLLESFAKLNLKNWRLVFLGEGPLLNDLKTQGVELGIIGQLVFPGAVENVDEWLARSSIFAFPSISEGFPNALAEAMAAGLPCVSFDCDAGPRDIIKNEINGLLVDVYNVNSLFEKLELLIRDADLRNSLGEEAKKIRKELEISMIAESIIDFCLVKNRLYSA